MADIQSGILSIVLVEVYEILRMLLMACFECQFKNCHQLANIYWFFEIVCTSTTKDVIIRPRNIE